eukprot:UN01205
MCKIFCRGIISLISLCTTQPNPHFTRDIQVGKRAANSSYIM